MSHRKPISVSSTNLCANGCGNIAKFVLNSGKEICESSSNKCPVNKLKNSNGLKRVIASGERKSQSDIYKSLSADAKAKMNWNKDNFKADFSLNGKGSHKAVLINERGHQCERCGLSEWLNEPIVLELDHIDGNNKNNEKSNLKLLCPNCHSLTPTWRGRNINSGKIKVTDSELIDAISRSSSIRQALLLVGLSPKGGNYVRCNDLIYGGLVKLANTSGLSPDASA